MTLNRQTRQLSRPALHVMAPLDALWRWCTRPLVLLGLALLALGLALLGLALPQLLPPDLDVLTSPLLRWLFRLLGALTLLQLGRQIGTALQLRRVQTLRPDDLRAPAAAGEPVALPMVAHGVLQRLRTTQNETPDAVLVLVRDELTERFGRVDEVRVQEISVGESDAAGQDEPVAVAEEMRLLATRDLRASGLRPLLSLGLLLALTAAWWAAGQSWSTVSPPLVPGETFAYTSHDFRVQYVAPSVGESLEELPDAVEDEGAQAEPGAANTEAAEIGQPTVPALTLRLQHGDEVRDLPLTQPETRLTLDGVRVRAVVVAPGLLVRTADGSQRLVAPGGSDLRSAVGLAFPSVNLEVELQQGDDAVLRFVRTAEDGSGSGTNGGASTGFLADVIPLATDGDPRSEVIVGVVQTLDAAGVPVEVVRVPSVQVVARRTPGGWLLVPAGLLIAAGLLGLWRRPAFVLVQIVPWPGARTVVVAQGSSRRGVMGLAGRLAREADGADGADENVAAL